MSQLIRKYSAGLQTSEFAQYLGEYHHDLVDGSLSPTVEVVGKTEPIKLKVIYSTGVGLERDLDDYLEVGGVCLEVDETLPPLADVLLVIGGIHLQQTVTLRGRAVRETPAGVAFQVNAPEPPIADSLREMPEKMRQASAEAGQQALATAAQAAQAAQATQSAPRASTPTIEQASGTQREPICAVDPDGPMVLDGEPTRIWDLAQQSVPDILLGLLDRTGLSVLEVEFGERRAQVVLDGANVVDVEIYPTAQKETLESLLLAAGKLDEADIDRAERYTAQHGVCMAEALVDLGILSYAEMGLALKTRARFLLGILWKKTEGRARLWEVDELSRRFRAPKSPLAYHLFRRMRDGFKGADDAWLEERRDFFRAHLTSRAPEPLCDIAQLDLGKRETRFYELVLETPRPLSELTRISRLGDDNLIVLLECFRRLGMLTTEETNPWTRRRTKFVEQIARMKARLHAKNHFETLGVHWTAYDEEIEEAYRERMAGLADDKLPDELDEGTRETIDELRQKLTEAYELLSDTRRRATYRSEIAIGVDRKAALEMFLKQADTAKLRRDIDSAIDSYRRVLEIKPKHPLALKDLEVLEKLKAAESR
ncbi:J domain-containing protein [Persicimonas caeni]|uniref:J domain-containing protein n=1 Tax=Persicimonas caeni TaxID=2292766 RepID=UPI00143CF888|nr:DnaJ domain-containing protein [Persicimonas caeni]